MFRWIIPWIWGAGLGGSGPPAPAVEGPYWVSTYHLVQPRCWGPVVREPQVLPGRIWAEDRTLMVFAYTEDE